MHTEKSPFASANASFAIRRPAGADIYFPHSRTLAVRKANNPASGHLASSSHTSSTPFGRYRLNHITFGIHWQQQWQHTTQQAPQYNGPIRTVKRLAYNYIHPICSVAFARAKVLRWRNGSTQCMRRCSVNDVVIHVGRVA